MNISFVPRGRAIPFVDRDEGEDPTQRLARRTAALLQAEPMLQDTMARPEIVEAITQPGTRLGEIVTRVMEGYADRPALGRRAYELATDEATGRRSMRLLPTYQTYSYAEIWGRACALSRSLASDADGGLAPGDFICILAFASVDYVIVDLASIRAGAVSVPLQTNMSVSQLVDIVGETRPRYLATSIASLGKAVDVLLASDAQARLLVLDYEPEDDDHRDAFRAATERLAAFGNPPRPISDLHAAAEAAASGSPGAAPFEEDPLVTIFYTSGSTGSPKGAMYPERLFRMFWMPRPEFPTVVLHYQPLNHLAGRALLMRTLASGGLCCFAARSDLSTLFEDMTIVRPTMMTLVPRILEMIFRHYQSEVASATARGVPPASAQRDIMVDMRANYLGGRMLSVVTGTAPCPTEVTTFINTCFDVDVNDMYGATENNMIAVDGRIQTPPVIDYKLVDVPELGYFSTDKPFPRGELRVKTANVIPGYFRNPELTASLFDEEGYYKTGDIFEERGPGLIAYVDRRNNVLKLAQGEFVAISGLEGLYASGTPLIAQIYVYGNSERSFLLAVIVPNPGAVVEQLGPSPDRDALRRAIRAAINAIARNHRLNGYEVPRDFLIEDEPFSVANGLLTDNGKSRRPELKARYGTRLEQMYDDLAATQLRELQSLRDAPSAAPVLDTLVRAVQVTLGIEGFDTTRPIGFVELGGDSLAAVSFATLIEETFGVGISVGTILSPTGSLQHIARMIETTLSGDRVDRPGFASIHGAQAGEIRARDLLLERFIDAPTLAMAGNLPPADMAAPATVLLTGANGYLGRFLCLEWLKRLASSGGRLICVVRAPDSHAARQRLDDAFGQADERLTREFATLADRHLDVLAGDIAAPRLGLDAMTWERLADTVDLIVHPAALVNHILPYAQLFEPNVAGTAELIALALSKRLKRFNFVSSTAVCRSAAGWIDEDADIRAASPVRPITDTYADGYASSKWAGEVLLRQANERVGLPVTVFRSDMILAHSEYHGQINATDIFTRLLFSLATTGIAPPSFYMADVGNDRMRPHYDGLPVDFIAAAVVAIGGEASAGYRSFHVLNPHDDDISLDSFVDWMMEAGCGISRLGDHGEWLARFETALRALPEKQRAMSSLAVLDQLRVPGSGQAPPPVRRFQDKVRALTIGGEGDIPHLSAAFIRKCLADIGLLPGRARGGAIR